MSVLIHPFYERVVPIYRIVQSAISKMKEGSFVFTSGTLAVRPAIGMGAVGAAISAVEHLTRTLALELAPIRSNAIAPGLILTDLMRSFGGENWQQMVAQMSAALPGKKPGSAEQAADAIKFLILNKFINGEILTIDGGGRFA